MELDQQHALTVALGQRLAYLTLFASAHLAVRPWATYADPLTLPCVALLTGLRLVMIHRLDLAGAANAAGQGQTASDAVMVVYLVLISRGLRTAHAARDGFSTLLAAGLSFSMALQVFIVVGGVTNLIPETGLTAPFLSYGGSSLLANYILVAILLRISHHVRRPAGPPPARPATPLAEAATMAASRVPSA